MTRISDYSTSRALLSSYLRAEQNVLQAQEQVATGKKAQTYEGYGRDATRLLSAENLVTRAQVFETAAKNAENRLAAQDIALTTSSDAATDLRGFVTEALATGKGVALDARLDSIVGRVSAALNTEIAGEYLFAGTRSDTPPSLARSVADLTAAASIDDLFQNNQKLPQAQIEDGVVIDVGVRANDVATDLFTEIAEIAAQGPFDGDLTDAQVTFLTGKLTRLSDVADELVQVTAANGDRQRQVENAVERNGRTKDYAEAIVADIADVDLAEAISRLTQDQTALEASARTLATVTQLSLLDFI